MPTCVDLRLLLVCLTFLQAVQATVRNALIEGGCTTCLPLRRPALIGFDLANLAAMRRYLLH